MPRLLTEPEAYRLTQDLQRFKDQLSPEQVGVATQALLRYRTSQENRGLPVFPTAQRQEQERDAMFRSIFTDKVDHVLDYSPGLRDRLVNSTDPERDKMTAANFAFLNKRTGLSNEEIMRRGYGTVLGQYSTRQWGTPVTDDKGFFSRAQQEVRDAVADEEKHQQAMLDAVRAVGKDGTFIQKFDEWKRAQGEKGLTFAKTYQEISDRLEPHRDLVKGMVGALKSYMDGDTGKEEAVQEYTDQLASLPARDRALVVSAVMAEAERTADATDKSWTFWQQTGESFARTMGGAAAGMDTQQMESAIESVRGGLQSGTQMLAPPEDLSEPKAASAWVRHQLAFQRTLSTPSPAGFAYAPAVVQPEGWQSRQLSDKELSAVTAALDKEQVKITVARQVQQAAQTVDPVKNVFSSAIGSSAAALPFMAMGMGGIAILAKGYAGLEYDQLRLQHPDMSAANASAISAVSGAVQAGLDRLEFIFLRGKLPSFSRLVEDGVMSQTLKRAGIRAVEGFTFENVQEGLQDITTPVVQEIASRLSADVPSVDWQEEWVKWSQGRADIALGTLPLVLLGVGIGTVNDVTGAADMLRNERLLGQMGFTEQDRVNIMDLASKGDAEGAMRKLRESMVRRDPEVAKKFATEQSEVAKQFEQLLKGAGEAHPVFSRGSNGWTVTMPDGQRTTAGTWEEAKTVAAQGALDGISRDIEEAAQLADFFIGQNRQGVSETATFEGTRRTVQDDVADKVISEEEAVNRSVLAGQMMGLTREESLAQTWAVLGRNVTDTQGQVATSASKLFHGSNVLTVVEEVVEGRWKAGLENKTYTREQALQWINLAEQATGEKFLHADTEAGVVEAISAIVVADTLGRRKTGKLGEAGFDGKAGAITRGVVRAIGNVSESNKFAAFLHAFRAFFKQVFQRARALQKAKKEGKLGNDWQAFMDELLGVDENIRQQNAAATEAKAMVESTSEAAPAQAEKVSTVKVGSVVRYSGYLGRLNRDGERYTIETPERVVELSGADLVDVVSETDPAAMRKVFMDELAATDVQVNEDIQLAPSGMAITINGRRYVPQNRKLSKNVTTVDGKPAFRVLDPAKGRITLLRGEQAAKAIDLFLEAAEREEAQGRKVSYSLTRQTVTEDFFTKPGTFYRVVGEDAFNDIVDTGLVRTNSDSKTDKTASLMEKLAARPTAFPSFSKDAAALYYAAGKPNHYIIVTNDPSIQLSTAGRHSVGKTHFPTDANGNHLRSMSAENVSVYRHDGNGVYSLVYEKGSVVQEPSVSKAQRFNQADDRITYSLAPITPQQDAEYMAAVEAGDMETAQRMVDEAAKAAGYGQNQYSKDDFDTWAKTIGELAQIERIAINNSISAEQALKNTNISPVLRRVAQSSLERNKKKAQEIQDKKQKGPPPKRLVRGDSRADITVYRGVGGRSIWATDSEQVAKTYGDNVRSFFLEMKNPLVVDADGRSFRELSFEDSKLDADDLSDIAKERGYDGLIIRNFYDSNTDDGGDVIADHFTIFNPNQIKSADPVTYDDAGNVIPLSQRFNPADDRITYSLTPQQYARHAELEAKHNAGAITPEETAEAQRLVDEAAKRAGFDAGPVFHFGSFDPNENPVLEINGQGMHFGTENAARERAYGKIVDDFIKDGSVEYDNEKDAWFWTSEGVDSYDVIDEEGFASQEAALASLERFASEQETDADASEFGIFTKAFLRGNFKKMSDQKDDWGPAIRHAKSEGYDGIYYKNDFEDKGSTSYIIFNPGQAKSADPFTSVPLAQRFNPADDRITYSLAPQKFSEAIQTELKLRLDKDPDARRKFYNEILKRFAKLRDDIDVLNAGDVATSVLRKEAIKRQDARYFELRQEQAGRVSYKDDMLIRQKAKEEADTWLQGELDKQPTERERILGMLKVYNAALMGIPASMRGKVGGMMQVASVKSSLAGLEVLKKNIAKVGKLVEAQLREDYQDAIAKLLKRGLPDRKGGKGAKSDVDADTADAFEFAAAAMKLTEGEIEQQVAAKEAIIRNPNSTEAEIDKARDEMEMLELMGDMKNADAGRLAAIHDTLDSWLTTGILVRNQYLLTRRNEMQRIKEAFIKATGIDDVQGAQALQHERVGTLKNWQRNVLLDLGSFNELIYYITGGRSDIARELLDMDRKSDYDLEDLNEKLDEDVKTLFASLAGGEHEGHKLFFDMSARRNVVASDKSKWTQMEAIHIVMTWRQEDGRRHMEGKRDELGKLKSTWSYDQTFVDSVESQLTPESKAVMAWLYNNYRSSYPIYDALHRTREGVSLPFNYMYSPISAEPSKAGSDEMVDPSTGLVITDVGLKPPSLRTRTKSTNRPVFKNAMQLYIGNTRQMNLWVARYDFIRTIQGLFLSSEVLEYVRGVAGDEGVRLLKRWTKVFVQGGYRSSASGIEITDTLTKWINRASATAILGRLSTLSVQVTTLAAAEARMPVSTFMRLQSQLFTGQLNWTEAFNSPFIQRRVVQKSPMLREAMQSLSLARKPNIIKVQQRRLADLMASTDGFFTAGTYTIMYHYKLEQAESAGMSGAEAEAWARNEAERETEEVTQPMRQSQRSLVELEANSSWLKAFMAFASEPRQKLAMFLYSLSDRGAAGQSDSNKLVNLAKVAFVVFGANGLLVQALKSSWLSIRGKDDEDTWSWQNMLMATMTAPLSGFPGWQALTDTGSLFSAPQRSVGAWGRFLEGESFEDMGDLLKDAESMLSSLGLMSDTFSTLASYSHFLRDMYNLVDTATSE